MSTVVVYVVTIEQNHIPIHPFCTTTVVYPYSYQEYRTGQFYRFADSRKHFPSLVDEN
jgi:hypothetical protein